MTDVNRQWILTQRPKGRLAESDFELREAPVPTPGPGEALTRTLYISVDAANRAWMSPVRTYIDPVEPGGVMRAMTLGEVVRSADPALSPGDIVEGAAGWQDFAVAPARALRRVAKRTPLSLVLSGLGVTSLTAYFGLLDVAARAPARRCSCPRRRARGFGGRSDRQARRLPRGRDRGLSGEVPLAHGRARLRRRHRLPPRRPGGRARAACPGGIDVYFDNVGGRILETALFQMREGGRIVCCGAVSQYDTASPEPGPRGVPGPARREAPADGGLHRDGPLRPAARGGGDPRRLDRRRAPGDPRGHRRGAGARARGAGRLLRGDNLGKRMVRVAPDPR